MVLFKDNDRFLADAPSALKAIEQLIVQLETERVYRPAVAWALIYQGISLMRGTCPVKKIKELCLSLIKDR